MLIDDPERARRLARAICADVALYNVEAAKAAAPADRAQLLREPVNEARGLYQSRVVPDLHPIFEEEIAELCQRLESDIPTVDAAIPAPHVHPPIARAPVERVERTSVPEPVSGGGGFTFALAALALLMLAALAGWFVLMR